jgi:hypothetical protein
MEPLFARRALSRDFAPVSNPLQQIVDT